MSDKSAIDPFHLYLVFIFILVAALADFIFFKNRRVLAALLGGSFFIFGLWRFALTVPVIDSGHIAYYNGQDLVLSGAIFDEPDVRDNNSRYTLENVKLKNHPPAGGAKLAGRVLLITKNYPEYNYGDKLEMRCKLEKPEPVDDFDYPAYLARDNIFSLCRFPKEINLLAVGQASRLKTGIYWVKNKFAATVNRLLPEPQAAFLGGILYGARQSIPADLKEDFKKTGTTHLIAVSGYNISIVAGFIIAFLSYLWIPRKAAFPLATLAIILFVILTGAGASVVRAGIMGLIVLLAKNVGRLSSMRNLLVFAAAAMLLQNPKILALDLGFQLSFAATIGLVVMSPYFAEKLKFVPTCLGLREAVSATLSAIIFTLPLLLYNFGLFSLIAPVANILVVPFIPLTMSMGFAAALLGLLYLPLGAVAGWLVWVPLTYEISVIKFLAKFPVVEWKISLVLFVAMYAAIILLTSIISKSKFPISNQIQNPNIRG